MVVANQSGTGRPGDVPAARCIRTGQLRCYDAQGEEIPCRGTFQDGALRKGRPWPHPRFRENGATVLDVLTGLTWSRDANPTGFPCDWDEAWGLVQGMNADAVHGYTDWRIPTRRELRSLLCYQSRNPVLPGGHPFTNVFLGWYWTSTTAAINTEYAWYVHMAGARMFYGRKRESCFVWPVRGVDRDVILWTGQTRCYDRDGRAIPCEGTGQDAEGRTGRPWPEPRFTVGATSILDELTGLEWFPRGDLLGRASTWQEALDAVSDLNAAEPGPQPWRLPNVNELESLVDCARHSPALPAELMVPDLREEYWSSTTSAYEPDWAWALYVWKGAIGVGHKAGPHFHVWPVRDAPSLRFGND